MNGQSQIVEIIPSKLYWISDRAPPRNQSKSYYFCIDNDLVYQPFSNDFGPLNIGMTYKFCTELEKLIQSNAYSGYRIYHYTSLNPAKRANAAYLMGAFQILILGRTSLEAWQPFTVIPPFADFRDAGYGSCTYKCTILHCLRGLEKGVELGWFNLKTFNIRDYEFYEKVENGDWNWIIPGKLLAFASPSPTSNDTEGFKVWTPEDYAPLFHKLGVGAVIRLNNKTYDAEKFVRLGIKHYDLYFLDGSCPSESIISDFLRIVENEPGAVAVHCKAGLGRTGTLIGIYAMKHYRFPAADFIGWIRLCRPGSVLGPQQQFLCDREQEFFRMGNGNVKALRPIVKVDTRMSPEEKYISTHGDNGQAERLISAKKTNQSGPNTPLIPEKSPPRTSTSRNQSVSPASSVKKGKTKSPIRYGTPNNIRSPNVKRYY
ncbi:unnamed protein product [Blepharisma stoltei]|uniref:protein-tyrosine-phosphatase n=1 Tax=Blepharisma stoltei TaxID=1481888 RepID=A0AAU9J2K2_9CILI|nr:unnamed protein product [Blepharisma stoltei]